MTLCVTTNELNRLQGEVDAAQSRVDNAEGLYLEAAIHELRAAEIRRDIYIAETTGKSLNTDVFLRLPWLKEVQHA